MGLLDRFPSTKLNDINLDWILKKIRALRGGATNQLLAKASDADFDFKWVTGGGGGTSDYDELVNRPQINSVTLTGNLSASDLGLLDSLALAGYRTAAAQDSIDAGKQTKITASGMLKGDGNGGVSAATAGTDYLAPSALSSYRTASAQDSIDAAQNVNIASRAEADELGIVITGARPGAAATAGQYVFVRDSTITGITDGLYKAVNALSPSTDVAAADLSSVNGGGLNDVSKPITSVSVYYPTYRTGAEAVNADDGARVIVYSDGSKELKGIMVVTNELPNDNVEMLTFSNDVALRAINNGNMQGWGFMANSAGNMTVPIRFNGNKVYSWGTAVPVGIWIFSFRYC